MGKTWPINCLARGLLVRLRAVQKLLQRKYSCQLPTPAAIANNAWTRFEKCIFKTNYLIRVYGNKCVIGQFYNVIKGV
jgi:hypothetical protein